MWALEIAGYDTSSADMIATLYQKVRKSSCFGPKLYFHPTSDSVAVEAKKLPSSVPVITTDELYAGIDYQPLNLGTAVEDSVLYMLRIWPRHTWDTAKSSYWIMFPMTSRWCKASSQRSFRLRCRIVNVLSQNRKIPTWDCAKRCKRPAFSRSKTIGSSWKFRPIVGA